MIHFNCPDCGRYYDVPEALAGLPLVCKQCGQRMTVPAASTAAPPAPPPAPKPAPAPPPADEDVLVAKPDSTPDIDFDIGGPTAASLSDAARARPSGHSKAESTPTEPLPAAKPEQPPPAADPDFDLDRVPLRPPPGLGALPPEPLKAEAEPEPRTQEGPPGSRPAPAILPLVLDVVAFAVLVVAGLSVGEFLAHKPTGDVLAELAAPKFPPVDLILWAAPAALFAMLYLLLANRGYGLGSRFRRSN